MSAFWTRILLVTGALVLFVLLFFAPRQKGDADEASDKAQKMSASPTANLEPYFRLAEKTLSASQSAQISKYSNAGQTDSIIDFWNRRKRPDLAAYLSELKAAKTKLAADWFAAGNRYYYAVQFTPEQSEIPVMFQSAIRSFESGLKLEPGNTDAKIMLASCFVEGTEDPMKGVGLLRELERTDSNNVKLQMTFGLLSVRSKQWDKAIARFNKVLQIDSTNIETYLHLAEAYEQMGERQNTISMLEKYSAKTTEPTAKLQVNRYIEELKETK